MAIKFNKNNKAVEARTTSTGKLCTFTLVIQIILTISLGIIALAPMFTGLFGAFLYLTFGAAMIIITLITVGIIWTVEGVRVFFFGKEGTKGAFAIAGDIMNGSTKIVPSLKPYIVAISLSIFFVAACGFVYNLIYFIKHDKANKGRFIASCIFLGLATINLIITFIVYFTSK